MQFETYQQPNYLQIKTSTVIFYHFLFDGLKPDINLLNIPYRVIILILSYMEFEIDDDSKYSDFAFYFKYDICKKIFALPSVHFNISKYKPIHRPILKNIVSLSVVSLLDNMAEKMVQDIDNPIGLNLALCAISPKHPEIYNKIKSLRTYVPANNWWTPSFFNISKITHFKLCACSIPVDIRPFIFKNIEYVTSLTICVCSSHTGHLYHYDCILHSLRKVKHLILINSKMTNKAFKTSLIIENLNLECAHNITDDLFKYVNVKNVYVGVCESLTKSIYEKICTKRGITILDKLSYELFNPYTLHPFEKNKYNYESTWTY